MKKVKHKMVNGKMMVNPLNLKINPLNTRIYNNKEEEEKTQTDIANDYMLRISEDKVPNIQPVLIWPDGLVDAGNTRTVAGLIAGCDIWCEYTDAEYPDLDNKPYSALKQIQSSNIYRKITHSVRMNIFEATNKAYIEEYGMSRPTKEEDEHLKELGTSRPTMKKLIEIKKHKPELLKKVDAGQMAVKVAWEEATGRNKVKVITSNNPDRDWSEIYEDSFFTGMMNRVFNTIKQMMNISVNINGDDYNPLGDFTKGTIAGNISHLMETIGAELLRSEGHDVRCASGHPTDPDIYHNDIDDKVEIKVTNYKGGGTTWKGGMGIREGQYILMTYDESMSRLCLIFTKLDAKDWKSAGIGGHTLPISNVYKNHKDDWRIIYGDVYESNGKIFMDLKKY
tara:strand:+ start:50 stop:1234 length:1185 start_codon:yes stop_codon:yes gene_type:complete